MNVHASGLQNTGAFRSIFHCPLIWAIRGFSIIAPIIVGQWRYITQSDSPRVGDFILGIVLSTPFSVGPWLATTELGKRIKFFTIFLILTSISMHFLFFEHAWPFALFIEIYAILALFREEREHDETAS
jgi:hypothetical protein